MSAAQLEKPAPLLIHWESVNALKEGDFTARLESKDDEQKIAAMEQIVAQLVNGELGPRVFMQVIKFCLNSDNHTIKKLLLAFFELVDKKNKAGQFLPEMILVCNAIKNNLTHPNEYVRGATLRFLCKIKEAEILESLIPSVVANLEHRHSYVRKYAVSCVCTIHRAFPEMISDAPQHVERFLDLEFNLAAKRNAFHALFQIAPDRAVAYLNGIIEQVNSMDESFQLVVLEVIRKVCRANPLVKSQYAKCVFGLLTKSSNAVSYEGANTLCALFPSPTAVRAAVSAYTRLLQAESDDNVKLIILGRLQALRKRNEKVLQELLMDILRTLSTPSIEVRRRTLDLALDLVSPRNVEEVVNLLKKEIVKTESPEHSTATAGKPDEYRKLLVDTMHQCAVRFPEVVQTVVHILMNYLGEENVSAGLDVIHFVREIVEESPALRDGILQKLLENLDDIRTSEVYRAALWILGEYATDPEVLNLTLLTIRTSVGQLPLLAPVAKDEPAAEDAKATAAAAGDKKHHTHDATKKATSPAASTSSAAAAATPNSKQANRPVILADGTYGSQSAIAATVSAAADAKSDAKKQRGTPAGRDSHLRSLLLRGDYYLASALANAFTKLLLRYNKLTGYKNEANEEIAKGMLLLVSILQLGDSKRANKQIDHDARQRIIGCIRVLMDPKANEDLLLGHGRAQFALLLEEQRKRNPKAFVEKGVGGKVAPKVGDQKDAKAIAIVASETADAGAEAEVKKTPEIVKQADDLITIRQLTGVAADAADIGEDEMADVTRAMGAKKTVSGAAEASRAKLNRVYQLSGFADPVYAEAHLTVHEYDIVLDVLVVNQTKNILQNFQLELNTSADLKVVDRPQPCAVPAFGVHRSSINIKVHSTESGVIFGNMAYDSAAGAQKNLVVLNNINMDIMDYIHPATVTDARFRGMWAEFEWENKVAINTDITELSEYLNHLLAITNMKNLTPQNYNGAACAFLAANLYARSIFGEDALLNLSVERHPSGKLEGYIRIRSKTQGIALSLGDKINSKQRGTGPRKPDPTIVAAQQAAAAAQAAAVAAAAAALGETVLPTTPAAAVASPKTKAPAK